MNNEYIIVNKTAIQKRIEELEKELAYHNEWYEKAREKYHQDRKSWGNADDGEMRVASDAAFTTAQEVKILKQILSQSVPLIPEIEKAFKAEPTMITDWLNEYGDPEIYKKVERELELREAAAIGKFAEKKYLERLNNFQSIDFKDGVFEGAKWMRDKILNK